MFLKTGALGLALAGLAQTGLAKELNLDDLFPRDRLLEINVTIPEEDWDTLRYQRRTRENALPPNRKFQPPPSPYTYVEADVTIEGVTYKKVGIRKKGFIGSQDTTRPSLKVKLDYNKKGQNIGGLRNLTFNNNRQDRSLMSQFMGYQIWDEAGSRLALRLCQGHRQRPQPRRVLPRGNRPRTTAPARSSATTKGRCSRARWSIFIRNGKVVLIARPATTKKGASTL